MVKREIHRCECENCQQAHCHSDQTIHYLINLFLSHLDEQQRRWYVAIEAERLGHGGTKHMVAVTGINAKTIRRGRRELAAGLATRPRDRARVAGGGRKAIRKKDAG